MLVNTDINLIKTLGTLFSIGCLCSTMAYAQDIDCTRPDTASMKKICADNFAESREKLSNHYITAFLVSDAPVRLLEDTHHLWFKRLQLCKNLDCYKQQFEIRIEDLNFYTSLNQSLTNHYLKFENGQFATQPVHLQVHQLTKDKIKIEGIAYRNPNNKLETQTIPFLAYTTAEQKSEIVDNEHDCKYHFDFNKAILSVTTKQKGCERFTGIYRLYD
ncbi:A1S_1983 family putative colistin resistance protein [Acinetobacter sp.]|uniref:A1S_1983 family putative colistin resistance protein n=1 Tax=Acinetobacter sp. TaxID=472 RepID=UPI003D05B95C